MRFEWDPREAAANLRKHRISFEEATGAGFGAGFVDIEPASNRRRWAVGGFILRTSGGLERYRGFWQLQLAHSEVRIDRTVISHFAEMSYAGQIHALRVPIEANWSLERMIKAYPETKYRNVHGFPTDQNTNDNFYALFDCIIDPQSGHYLSEDYAFCRRWRKLGGEIWIDLRSKLTHVGPYAFKGDSTARYAPLANQSAKA